MLPRTITADLSGACILVTGASSGLGEHFSRMLAAKGARIICAARRRDRLDGLVADIRAAGGQADAVTMDVADAASIRSGVAQASALTGQIDGLINNSGIAPARALVEQTADEWNSVIATNLSGARHVAVEVAKTMIAERTGGSIVNIASILALRQGSNLSAYATSKAALAQLTKQMALEWARHDIRVNALAPGYIETPMTAAFFQTEAGRAQLQRVPQRRLGKPDDLDGIVLLLLSQASSFMTGSIIAVDGGHLVSSL